MLYLRRGLWLVVFVGALIGGWKFADNNSAPVSIDYLIDVSGLLPLWLALSLSFGAGAAVASLALFARLTRSSLAQRRYRKTVAALESEVHQLRNLPVAETTPVAAMPVPERVAAGEPLSAEAAH